MGRRRSEPTNGAELPIRTDAQRIVAEKQAALVEAERALATARESYDEDGVVEAQARIRALKDILGDLDTRHVAESEDAARERARAWMEAQSVDELAKQIETAQAKAADTIQAACTAIEAEAEWRRRWAQARAGIAVLAMRWPELARDAQSGATLPVGPIDYAGRISDAAADVRDAPYRPLVVSGVAASSTEEERRRATLRTLYQALRRDNVPQEVRSILEAAPRPPEIEETAGERERRERAEARQARDAATMGSLVHDYRHALG